MVIRSKLIPPQPQRAIFQRPRLHEKLTESFDHPLTVIHAGTGFGKTSALIELSRQYPRVYWYDITETDRDPTVFIAHLISALLPNPEPLLRRLEQDGISAAQGVITALLNQLTTDLEEDAVLVMDDFHIVNKVPDIGRWLEQLVERRPPRLRISIACREVPETPAFIRWRVKGSVLILEQSDLSFTQDEILALFSEHHHFPITSEQAAALFTYTDGWIIALEMIWQRIQASHSKKLDNILSALPSALSEIFNFLAQEVLMRQAEPVQQFLVHTSVLRRMDAKCCNALLDITDSQEILQLLNEKGLFISTVDDIVYRYQRLFQDFLSNQAMKTPELVANLNRKAAKYYTESGDIEEAIFHQLACGDHASAARLIDSIGRDMLNLGRLRTLAYWIGELDERQMEQYPSLHLLHGDVLRLMSRFEEAVTAYNHAYSIYLQQKDPLGRSQALRSKAQVYLDTIRPLKASSLLEEAIALLEPQEHPSEVAELLDQLAENKLNLGIPLEALALHQEASMLRSESGPDDIYLEARSLLRTGRLQQGIAVLESSGLLDQEARRQRPQRFHREMSLLLALTHLMMGNVKRGEYFARQGIEVGQKLDSPFVEAVGWMRLGHAYQIYPQLSWRSTHTQKAVEFYQRSIELVRAFNVMRVQVEPLWGLCRFYGYQGNLAQAKIYADQAIDIAQTSGDLWFVALLNTSMGTAFTLEGKPDKAEEWLQNGLERFIQAGDIFGEATTRCAQVLNSWLNGLKSEAVQTFAQVVPLLREHDFGFILTKASMLGVQNPQIYLPLLIESQRQGLESDWIAQLIKDLGLENAEYHPGYGLEVRTLGPFEVWRDGEQVSPHDWQREKARQLFQFLVTNRGKWFTREQLSDRLWPHLDIDGSGQTLKVALSALNHALEPMRDPGRAPFFVARRENLYGLNPAAQICVDIDDFNELCTSPKEEDWAEALELYQADYLSENVAEPWADDMRSRLRDVYFVTAQRLLKAYLFREMFDSAIKVSHDILALDPCNEYAVQMLMQCHAARGNRATVNAVYQRCVSVLHDELDVEPSIETTRLWKQLTSA